MTENGPISSLKRPLAMLAAASNVHRGCSTPARLPHGPHMDTEMLGTRVHPGNVG